MKSIYNWMVVGLIDFYKCNVIPYCTSLLLQNYDQQSEYNKMYTVMLPNFARLYLYVMLLLNLSGLSPVCGWTRPDSGAAPAAGGWTEGVAQWRPHLLHTADGTGGSAATSDQTLGHLHWSSWAPVNEGQNCATVDSFLYILSLYLMAQWHSG